mmetsp:Transcript_23761/g.58218  ORF Transcript_23761/g.58218 Transcript_23761/m.58218 type:complete len:256 (+) Transcript_23761:44-811(+)|eukprot:CAMPEP_0113622808 /NCGR_PEP_ID=MMETSP0017_2-20120614/11706_1 /TAXON_ID=2856 /ORGANISM="Cylindrotheca closterium" /LENGTH=255 /DNA_ID=CAMNT_0000532685 /DNA_START=38 /DNA_END=805 /DNA_ORIENTATION=+ /assembly_acc=CAM_ASM_000147
MAFGKKETEEIPEVDGTAWIVENEFAEFVLMHTSEIKYMCMLGYTFMHGCKVFKYFEPTDSAAYRFVTLALACTGGGILVPIFLNKLPVTIAMDSYPIAITTSFFLHSMFPVLREVVALSAIFKTLLVVFYEIFRAFVVAKFTYAAAGVIPASEFEIAIFGPIICGAISGCGGAFLPMSKGLNPIKKTGLAPPMFSALIGATFFHLFVYYGQDIPLVKDKARVILATWFIGYGLYSNGLISFKSKEPAAGKTKKE